LFAGDLFSEGYTLPEMVQAEDFVSIGKGTMIAPAYVHHGSITLRSATLRNHVVVGCGSLVLQDTELCTGSVIGDLSCLHPGANGRPFAAPGQCWFGTPASQEPVVRHAGEDPAPSCLLDALLVGLHIAFGVWLATAPIFVVAFWGHFDIDGYDSSGWLLFIAPCSFFIAGAVNAALSLFISYLPFSDALHTEASTSGCCGKATTGESFATFYLGWQAQYGLPSGLPSTPYASWWLSALGAQCGRGVCINSLQICEPEVLVVQDGVCIGEGCFVAMEACALDQGRNPTSAMRRRTVVIARKASVQAGSVMLGGSSVEEGTHIGTVTLVKGDVPRLDPLTAQEVVWQGNPSVSDPMYYVEPTDFWSDPCVEASGGSTNDLAPIGSSLVSLLPQGLGGNSRGSEREEKALMATTGPTAAGGNYSGYGSASR